MMDRLGGVRVASFRREQIINAVLLTPKLLRHKKFIELFTGYLVAGFLHLEKGIDLSVGFPLNAISKESMQCKAYSLQELIDLPEIIDDSDVDVCLLNDAHNYSCQVTRLVAIERRNSIEDCFFELLEKKFKIQPDENLCLIINVEENISIDLDRLSQYLIDTSVPYGMIFLVGKSEDRRGGMFRCHQIYPELKESDGFKIGVPL